MKKKFTYVKLAYRIQKVCTMEEKVFGLERQNLEETLVLVEEKLNIVKESSSNLNSIFDDSNSEYFEYLKRNANKINEEDIVELVNMQTRLGDLELDSDTLERERKAYEKMLDKPYFAKIDLKADDTKDEEKYYIGLHSLVDDEKEYRVIDWRSPIASIFYDYEKGPCSIKTNSSTLKCNLLNKRQFGITSGKLDYYIDTTINIEDTLLQEALAKNTTNQMKSIVQTIQKEQNEIIRCDENKTVVVQGVAGSGKTAIALHRIAYLMYKNRDKFTANSIVFLSPNNALSSYISSVLPDLAEDDIQKMQLDIIARRLLKKNCIVERKYEQIERLINSSDLEEYNYKTSYDFLKDILDYAYRHYIENFDLKEFSIRDLSIDTRKIKELFFTRYADRDLFTRLRWITDNIFDKYFYSVKNPEKTVKLKELIFVKLYSQIKDKNCVKAYMNFLKSKGLKLELVGDKVKNEDAYGILFFKMFIFGLETYDNIKHLVIDEMQDYSAVQLYILSKLFKCSKTVLGDYNQTLNPEYVAKFKEDMSTMLGDDINFVTINKSYRQTEEIANFANKVGNKTGVELVHREGRPVDLRKISAANSHDELQKIINDYRSNGYKSIAIITRSNKDAKRLFASVSSKIPDINLIDDDMDSYDNNLCIISVYNSKGLEFDAVIIYNASNNYENEVDRNLLYIAATRALHRLTVVYLDSPSKFIDKN